MRFPLADWIDGHAHCRYSFGSSGMHGVVRPRVPSARQLREATEAQLRARLGELLDVEADRVFLGPGATEANAWVTWFVRRGISGRAPRCRVEFPEYPPLVDGARAAGYRVRGSFAGRADLAIVSQPRNPEGDLWPRDRLARFAGSARATLVDETFREFSPAPSVQRWRLPGVWTTGSFTKVYGGDDLRVGFVVAPERERLEFARFHGLVADEMARYAVAGALATLDARRTILARVRRIIGTNQRAWRAARPRGPELAASVVFDRHILSDGDSLARRCVRRSILVCPGSFFGDPSGVRLGLTRPTFPSDLRRYLAVADPAT